MRHSPSSHCNSFISREIRIRSKSGIYLSHIVLLYQYYKLQKNDYIPRKQPLFYTDKLTQTCPHTLNTQHTKSGQLSPFIFIELVLMKSFSNDLSPIQSKDKKKMYFADQITHKLQSQHSNESHNDSSLLLGVELQEQRISAAAKTLLYLFSPQIDLLHSLEHNLENYDKYQKARIILQQLLSLDSPIHQQLLHTSSQILKLQAEIEELSFAFHRLEAENMQKDQEIAKYRKTIIDLTHAYEQAKVCFTDEILEHKYEIQELRKTVELYGSKEKPRSRPKNKKVRLDVPERKRKDSQAYTDRSIYQRFTASQLRDQYQEKELKEEETSCNHLSFTHHHHIIEKYEFEKEGLHRKVAQLQEKLAKSEQTLIQLTQNSTQDIQQLHNKISFLENELKTKSAKLREKNKLISELLDSFQGKSKHID